MVGVPGITGGGALAQAARLPTIATVIHRTHTRRHAPMILLLLEALAALVLLIFIVWWTMFSGRKNGELPDERKDNRKD
jgi:hypothetical protein